MRRVICGPKASGEDRQQVSQADGPMRQPRTRIRSEYGRQSPPLGLDVGRVGRTDPGSRRMKSGSSGQADVDLSFYVSPLGGRAEPAHEFLERRGVLRGVLEPGEEVEGLA